MAEQYDIGVVECPGCGHRFKRSDIKADGIKCPRCGREIWAEVTIKQQDEHKLVKQFLDENGIGAFLFDIPWIPPLWGLWTMVVLYVLAIVAILCTGLSFWRFFWVAVFLFTIKFLLGRCYGKGRKVRSFFERNGYDLEAGLAAYNEFISGLGEVERETYCYEDGEFEKKMRTYVRAHVDVQSRFDAHHAREVHDQGTLQYEKIQTYEAPPDACPYCGAPYRVGDFSSHAVTCRKCGRSIGVANVVSDEELHNLLVEFVAKSKEENHPGFQYVNFAVCAAMTIWNVCESGVWDFLYSWSVLWLYAAMGTAWYVRTIKKRNKRYDHFLRQKRINLFEFEYFVKSEDGETGSDVKAFYEFKDRLMDLYRKSASMVKGGELA